MALNRHSPHCDQLARAINMPLRVCICKIIETVIEDTIAGTIDPTARDMALMRHGYRVAKAESAHSKNIDYHAPECGLVDGRCICGELHTHLSRMLLENDAMKVVSWNAALDAAWDSFNELEGEYDEEDVLARLEGLKKDV